jgi:hypothetical protein
MSCFRTTLKEEADIMKKALILLVLAVGVRAIAQDQSVITVKNSETSGGVVIVTALQPGVDDQAKLSLELHCNKGASACKAPESGSYIMVRLPKNWGMYDCANVDLYAATADPSKDQKIGEYCLNQK